MAKKKSFKRTVRRARASPVAKYRRRSSSGSGKENLINTAMYAAAYGGVRERISNFLAPYTSKVPLGTIGDEVVLGGVGYFLAKKSKNKMLKGIGRAALVIEAARVGEAIADGSAFGTSMKTGSTVNGVQVY